MNDRELLELAARAEGHGVYFDEMTGFTMFGDKYTGLLWNPLENDGDAFRLAVKLEMLLDLSQNADVKGFSGYSLIANVVCNSESDPCGASRRAIVVAAAQIGAGMP